MKDEREGSSFAPQNNQQNSSSNNRTKMRRMKTVLDSQPSQEGGEQGDAVMSSERKIIEPSFNLDAVCRKSRQSNEERRSLNVEIHKTRL